MPETYELGDSRAAPIVAYGEPTEKDMVRINALSKVPLSVDQLFVARTIASHDGLDSHNTHMDPATSLRNYVKDAQSRSGVPLLYGHEKGVGILPMGRVFAGNLTEGSVADAPDAKHLVTLDYYIPRNMGTRSGNTNDVIRAIETGSATDSSIGFGGKYKLRCDICGAADMFRSETCTHYPGLSVWVDGKRTEKVATAMVVDARLNELSPVWRGSAPGAEQVARMEYLVAKGVASRRDIEELDGASGQRMAAAIDWTRLGKDTRYFTMPDEKTPATDVERVGALGGALDVLATPPAPKPSDTPTPHETVQTGKPDAKREDAPALFSIPASRAEALGIKAEADFERMVQEAEDGRSYRSELIDLCHKTGVRAQGETYSREVNDRMLSHLDTKDLRLELTSRTNLAKEVFKKEPVRAEGDDPLASKLTQEFGGRQTVPTTGPLGDRTPAVKTEMPPKEREANDKLFA